MGAQSVTGVGQGMSNGVWKPENNAGCGNCSPKRCPPTEPKTTIKRGCFVLNISGGTASLKLGGASSLKVC